MSDKIALLVDNEQLQKEIARLTSELAEAEKDNRIKSAQYHKIEGLAELSTRAVESLGEKLAKVESREAALREAEAFKIVAFLSRDDIQVGLDADLNKLVVHHHYWNFEGRDTNIIAATRMAIQMERKHKATTTEPAEGEQHEHDLHCNALRTQPKGCEGCSCHDKPKPGEQRAADACRDGNISEVREELDAEEDR